MKKLFSILAALVFCVTILTGSVWSEQPTIRPCVDGMVWRVIKHTSSAFLGATTNAHGSIGEKPTYTVFTVTGAVYIAGIAGVVNTTLTDAGGAGEINLGVVGNTTHWVTTFSSDSVVANDIFSVSTTLGTGLAGAAIGATAVTGEIYLVDGDNIVETTTAADILTGQIDYYLIWAPAEPGATVTSAGTLS